MVERLLILKNEITFNKDHRLMKNDSINTDDDESLLNGDGQSLKVNSNVSHSLLQSSPSFDLSNDQDDQPNENSLLDKIKKKKQRRLTESGTNEQKRKQSKKVRRWYTQIGPTKPVMGVALAILLYFMWTQRNIWIPRLLTSNSRIRQTEFLKQEKSDENVDSPSSKDFQDENVAEKNNDQDQSPVFDNEEDSTKTTSTKKAKKVHLRSRRNKMSFSKESHPKTNRYLQHQTLDVNDDEDDDDQQLTPTQQNLFSSSKKRHRHHRSNANEQPFKKKNLSASAEHLFQQFHEFIKTQNDQNENFASILSQEIGLKKKQIYRLKKGQSDRLMTLEKFLLLLNRFDSKILIVSK